MAKVAIQGGVDNYLGKQPQVQAPRKWKSSPDKPETELAYITEAEKNLILKANIHGGLEGGPNMGPSGIMSLDSFGDAGGGGQSGADYDADPGGAGSFTGATTGGGGGNVSTAQLPPAVAAAVAAGKSTSVNTKEDEKKAKEEARDFRQINYNTGYQPVTFGDRINAHNVRKRNAYIKRILQQRQDKITSGLLQSNVPGIDVMDMKDYFSFVPSVKKYGQDGTGKYSQEFINDVLSNTPEGEQFILGDRAPPEFFSKINVASAPGGMYGKGAAALANIFGPGMAGPVTSERLNQLYNEYKYAEKIDPNTTNIKQMMKVFEPNRYKREYGPNEPSDDNIPFIPINYNTGADEEVVDDKEFAYHLGLGGQKVGADVTRASYIFNQGGRVPRNMGGIMNAVPRQGYFLGGIGKAIKGVVGGVADAAKKVLGSDVGKMAIAGLGAYYLGGGKNLGGSFFGNTGFGKEGFLSNLGRIGTYVKENPLKSIGLASVALPFLTPEAKPNENNFSDRGGSLTDPLTGNPAKPAEMRASLNTALANANGDPARIKQIQDAYAFLIPDERLGTYLPYRTYGVKDGGRIGKAEGGLMNLGGMEKDYRAEGGFVPIGREEKADDVPARLSVNEFVFTADAVRNAGGGDIDKGAEVMENMMKNLENGGTVSEESQGNTGAQEMFSVSERIGEVI